MNCGPIRTGLRKLVSFGAALIALAFIFGGLIGWSLRVLIKG